MPGKCVVCGKEKGRNKLYCSVKCRAEAQRNMRKCGICGKEFYSAPSGTERTCSRECSAKLRHFYGMSEQNKEVLKKAHAGYEESPNTGRKDTNANAKSWVIQSPGGDVYRINNLKKWAIDNEDIISPIKPDLFSSGIRDIKRYLLGKHKSGSAQYKGWRLLEWSEENKAREGFPERKKRKPRKQKMSEEERLKRKREREKRRNEKKRLEI